jgi:hypothetical protein
MTPVAAIASLIKTSVPHGFGLEVRPDGAVVKRSPGVPLAFNFRFAGVEFNGAAYDHGEQMHIRVETVSGVLPYSHEDATRRRDIMRVLQAIGDSCNPEAAWFGAGWYIDARQRVHFGIGVNIDPASSPLSVLSDIIHDLLPARGWVGLLDQLCRPTAPAQAVAYRASLPVPA